MGKVKINKDDKARVLLTELLPYEVPMLFSNEGLYSLVINNKYEYFFNKVIELSGGASDKRKYGIPFNYEIKKSATGDTRTLSVIHPYCQVYYIDLYSKYDTLMLHLCSKSPFSLRKISKVAKFYYSPNFENQEDPHKNSEVEVEPEQIDEETKYLKSYFTYEPIDLIYKFYERNEFQRLEQRFNYLMEFDISKCFYHIYTHSITWAVKDKESGKKNARAVSFENTFDKLMQLANYNETNGIVVGPEISRIFSEIIFQQIDINSLKRIELETDYKYGVDFEIRRYVDDYFVFANDEQLLLYIKKVFQGELNYYKLYLNPVKSDIKTPPFITNITVGKRELKNLLNQLFQSLIITEEEIVEETTIKIKSLTLIRKPFSISQNFIKDFQCIVKKNNISYDILSKDIVRYIKNVITKLLKNENIVKDKVVMEGFLLTVFDILFYAYSLNINSNTTFKLGQIIVMVCKFLESNDIDLRHTIYSKIIRDADFILTNLQRKSKQNETNIETLNLLISLKKLGKQYLFSEKRILQIFGLSDEDSYNKLNYFQLVSLIYYIDSNPIYNSIRNSIEENVISRYISCKDPFIHSELTLLFFDFICCPFISEKSKKKVMQESKYCRSKISEKIKEIEKQGKWFMDWDTEIDLEKVLKKKDWGTTY
ncbi:MAG: antiviral reverse transcriptase Drt3b [Bacteroidales bacterium]|nr:antiviral reverse transcriptase Drt3b [Bacteroidales bacterium]